MAESLLYITFKDTVSDTSPASINLAMNNLRDQLIAAAERLKIDPSAIYSYLRKDSAVKQPAIPKLEADLTDVNEKISEALESYSQPNTLLITEEDILKHIFKDLKRTKKSESIIKYLVQNSGTELTVDQLTVGVGLTKNDLSSWMAITGARIPAIVRPSRGVYKFNPDKLITK